MSAKLGPALQVGEALVWQNQQSQQQQQQQQQQKQQHEQVVSSEKKPDSQATTDVAGHTQLPPLTGPTRQPPQASTSDHALPYDDLDQF